MLKTLKNLLPFFLLVFAGLISLRALFHPGFYTGHDVWHIVARLYHFDQAIRDGQILPRWSGGLLNGFGYPLFIFSYQLPWFIAEMFVLSGVSIFDALKLVFIITYVLSGVTMYLWVSDMWGKRAGIMAGLVYLFTPYRFANIFVRANLGEATGFIFFPLIFWSLYRLNQKKYSSGIIIGSAGISGALLSHVMAAGLFLLPVGLFFGFSTYIIYKTNKISAAKYISGVLLTFILGTGLAAYYLLPAITYKPLTVFSDLYRGLYKEHFTPLVKLIYSRWEYGAIGTPLEMSRQVGLVIWIIVGISLLVSVGNFIFRKGFFKKTIHVYGLIFTLSFFGSLVMMLPLSKTIWKMFENATLIDFPWRFLAVTTVCGSVLAGYLAKITEGFKAGIVLSGIILAGIFYTNRNHMRVNQYTDIPMSLYIASELTTNTDDEYLPKWVSREYAKKEIPLVNLNFDTVKNMQTDSHSISFTYASDKEVKNTEIHHMYFPGWNYKVDGKNQPVAKSGNGGMMIDLPQGNHEVVLRFSPTAIMRIGEIITTISIVIFGFVHTKMKLKKI